MEEIKKEPPQEHKNRMLLISNEVKHIVAKINILCADKKITKKDKQRISKTLIDQHIVPFGNAMLDLYVHAHNLKEYFPEIKKEENVKIETTTV